MSTSHDQLTTIPTEVHRSVLNRLYVISEYYTIRNYTLAFPEVCSKVADDIGYFIFHSRPPHRNKASNNTTSDDIKNAFNDQFGGSLSLSDDGQPPKNLKHYFFSESEKWFEKLSGYDELYPACIGTHDFSENNERNALPELLQVPLLDLVKTESALTAKARACT